MHSQCRLLRRGVGSTTNDREGYCTTVREGCLSFVQFAGAVDVNAAEPPLWISSNGRDLEQRRRRWALFLVVVVVVVMACGSERASVFGARVVCSQHMCALCWCAALLLCFAARSGCGNSLPVLLSRTLCGIGDRVWSVSLARTWDATGTNRIQAA